MMIRINGARLRQWRDELQLSQEDFSELIGTTDRTIRKAENTARISEQLADAICARLHKSKADLLRLSPDLRVALLDGRTKEQGDLFDSGLQCHKRLFKGYFAEVSRSYLKHWLMEGHFHNRWREIFTVAYEDHPAQRNVVALTCLSGHRDGAFWYCTRLGVLPDWRDGLTVEKLLFEAIKDTCAVLLPKAQTVIWEVEAPDLILLTELRQHIAAGGKLKTWPDQQRMSQAMRSARRLELFDWFHAFIATTPSGSPLTITSPAWREPLNSSNEREMMLLIHPLDADLGRVHPLVANALDFVYTVLYGGSFGGRDTSISIPGYLPYIDVLLRRMKSKAVGCIWGPLPRFGDLITLAKAEGLWDEIALIEAEK